MTFVGKQKPTFDISIVMEYSVAVTDYQGFVSSGNGWWDNETETRWHDNKTVIGYMLDGNKAKDKHAKACLELVETDPSVTKRANEIIEHFQSSLTFKKLSSTLNGFEERVAGFIMNQTVDKFGVSVAASLPKSYTVDQKREDFNDMMNKFKRTSGRVGKVGERVSMELKVIDIKYLRNFGNFIVTTIYDDKHIVKFFWNKDPDLTKVMEGKTLSITARVKGHELSKYTNCTETMLNYMKIEEIKG